MAKGRQWDFTEEDILARIKAGDNTRPKLARHFGCSVPCMQRRVLVMQEQGAVVSRRAGRITLLAVSGPDDPKPEPKKLAHISALRSMVHFPWSSAEVQALVAEDRRQMEAREGIYGGAA